MFAELEWPLALAALALTAAAPAPSAPPTASTPQTLSDACKGREGYSDAAPPERLFGNVWYVGTCGITVLLVTSPRGHVLIDAGPKDAAALVAANIVKAGFRLRDIRWLLSSHEHEDHAGGLAELKRLTGAKVAALAEEAPALETGKPSPDDPLQREALPFAPVKVDRILRDGEQLAFGGLRITAHAMRMHTPGSTSWTWTSCQSRQCRTMTYADSATLVADETYRFSDYPQRTAAARAALARFAGLPCGILITPHPGASDLFARMAGLAPLNDPQACRRYSERAAIYFDARVAREPKRPQ